MIFLTTYILQEKDWVTGIFVLVFILLGIVKLLYNDRLIKLIFVFFNKDYFLNYGKESKLIVNWFNVLLFSVQSLIITLLIFKYLLFYKPAIFQKFGNFIFLKIALVLLLFLLLRALIGKLLGILFEVNKQHEFLTFSKMSYLYSASLWIFPFLLFTFYIEKYNLLVFKLSIGVFTILLIIRYVEIIKYNKINISRQIFYFILYLCALEIAPVLLAYKTAIYFQ